MENNDFLDKLGQFKKNAKGKVPPINDSRKLLLKIIELLFPIYNYDENTETKTLLNNIKNNICLILTDISYNQNDAQNISQNIIEQLPQLYNELINDADAIYQGDPAAESIEEVIVTYPGFYAITIYRIANLFYKHKVPVLPRLFTEFAHKETGIDINPGAQIGQRFCIDHGTGIVIGETAVIGNNVKIYQGVTLGALSVTKEKAGTKRHPTIGNNVTIYAGSTILGGTTIIGDHTVIGGNVWLTQSTEPHSIVLNKSEVFVKNKNPQYNNIIDFVI